MSDSDFKSRVDELSRRIDSAKAGVASKEKCVPTLMIIGVIVPILLWLVLYFTQPSFVQQKEGDKYTRSTRKVFYWTIGATLVVWVALYMFTYFKSQSGGGSMFCKR